MSRVSRYASTRGPGCRPAALDPDAYGKTKYMTGVEQLQVWRGIDLVLNALHSATSGPWGWSAAHGGNESRMQKWLAHFVGGTETNAATSA
ncbi:hypothetical protein GOACH_10_01560 [Gordonia aichiensis NBRC 108223]|uniref:Uncharacterized protein n=1 Tax=Gordonia aichiensis NBRC 108223 TaxID=1220583 RepID=L7KNA3_9ACTN|nr:hypothetical protein GOACH_10_01560 [Gordonia aichiensis NBRC 108223]